MRLIDADALMREFAKFVRASNNSDFADVPTWNDAVSLLGAAPTIDAVPVVRCRECRYSRKPNRAFRDEAVACEGVLVCCVGLEHVHPTSEDGMIFVDGDGFCSNGERKDGDING